MSLRTLGIVSGIACASSILAGSMRIIFENKIGASEVCKTSVNMMHAHDLCIQSLGPPVKVGRPNVCDKFTVISGSEATIAIPVKGTKCKGNLLISVFNHDATWKWKYLKLSKDNKDDDLILFGEDSSM